MSTPYILTVEGNIGSGKSTFVKVLQENLKDSSFNVVFLQEPVNEWNEIKDKSGETILAKFYKNQEAYSFSFQMMAYISRLALLKKAVEENPGAIIITERCLMTDREVFAKMLYDQGKIEEVEYLIYLKWFNTFQKEFPITKHIYLRTDPNIAHSRVLKRNREGEAIEQPYLTVCHNYHEEWLKKDNVIDKVLTIDANENEDKMSEWLNLVVSMLSE